MLTTIAQNCRKFRNHRYLLRGLTSTTTSEIAVSAKVRHASETGTEYTSSINFVILYSSKCGRTKNSTWTAANFLQNRSHRPFSLCSKHCSVKDKLANYYVRRDEMRIKRRKYYDIFSGANFVKACPETWQPYLKLARVDKPIGTWLLYIPCTMGICLATPLGSLPSFYYLGLFGVGAFLMRGAGCVINDLWDRNLDKLVERTRDRPITSGKITPNQAIALLATQLTLSLGILLSLNTTCIVMGIVAMVPVILYPLAKRVTNYPQAVLGLTFNVGAAMGYVAVAGTFYWQTILPLYLGCLLWTLYYDTIYALQDARDDAAIGIKSTALLLLGKTVAKDFKDLPAAERINEWGKVQLRIETVLGCGYLATLVLWGIAAYTQNLPFPIYFVFGLQALKCVTMPQFQIFNPEMCWKRFEENKGNGFMVVLGIILSVYIGHRSRDVKKPAEVH